MINSELGVLQTYRSRFSTQLPKVNIGTNRSLVSIFESVSTDSVIL